MNKIPLFKVQLDNQVPSAIEMLLKSGYVGQGKYNKDFELELQRYIGNDNLLTLNSGTSALQLALHLLKQPRQFNYSITLSHFENGNIPEKIKNPLNSFGECNWNGLDNNSYVLSTPLTCQATNFAIETSGLNIKWVDVDPNTLNMDLTDLRRKISKNTHVIMIVHLAGYPLNLDELEDIRNECYDLYGFKPMIIEDCSQAFGSKFDGLNIGATKHNNFRVFSFQAIKHLTTVDGGALICPDEIYFRRAKNLRWYGINRNELNVYNRESFSILNVSEAGFKYHMNDLNSIIGLYNLKNVNKNIEICKNNSNYYDEALKDVDGIKLLKHNEKSIPAPWLYSIVLEKESISEFTNYMLECNIGVSQVHSRNDKYACLSKYKSILPNMNYLENRYVCLPVGNWVTNEEREYIVNCIKKFIGGNN